MTISTICNKHGAWWALNKYLLNEQMKNEQSRSTGSNLKSLIYEV